jgi:flagellar basal body-associated protein FliL
VKTLDNKTLTLLRKIDPIYESIIRNNFYQIESNTLTAIVHRISLIESIINDLNQIVINYQIS